MKAFVILFFMCFIIAPSLVFATGSSDFNNDTCVDTGDFAFVRSQWGGSDALVDVTADGIINVRDLAHVMKNWSICSNHIDTSVLYPFAPGHTLHFVDLLEGSNKFEIMSIAGWSDDTHFTVHHQYGNVGSPAPFCPRTDDVFAFWNDQLFYTDTYSFYNHGEDPISGLTRTQYSPGKTWLRTSMQKDLWYEEPLLGAIYDISQTDCTLTSSTLRNNTTDSTKVKIGESTTWSPYTGGQGTVVPTLLFTQVTYFNQNSDDWFQEDWHFYKDPQFGYIPIQETITRKNLGDPTPGVLSDEFLQSVQ